jgi:hypothetical protein
VSNTNAMEAVMETTSDELEPSVLLPSQFFGGDTSSAALQPDKRLMLAVLEEAVTTFQRHAAAQTRAGRRLFADVEAWIAIDDVHWPFSFVNICHTLGLEPASDTSRAHELAPPRSGVRHERTGNSSACSRTATP